MPNEACYGEGNIACEMFVAFCQPLPPAIDSACYGASVCQVGIDSEGGAHAYSMGQFKKSVRFVPSKDVLNVCVAITSIACSKRGDPVPNCQIHYACKGNLGLNHQYFQLYGMI